ncbi:hypothetical protein THAOC_27205, partial [Thalassiosira oceanica]
MAATAITSTERKSEPELDGPPRVPRSVPHRHGVRRLEPPQGRAEAHAAPDREPRAVRDPSPEVRRKQRRRSSAAARRRRHARPAVDESEGPSPVRPQRPERPRQASPPGRPRPAPRRPGTDARGEEAADLTGPARREHVGEGQGPGTDGVAQAAVVEGAEDAAAQRAVDRGSRHVRRDGGQTILVARAEAEHPPQPLHRYVARRARPDLDEPHVSGGSATSPSTWPSTPSVGSYRSSTSDPF